MDTHSELYLWTLLLTALCCGVVLSLLVVRMQLVQLVTFVVVFSAGIVFTTYLIAVVSA